MIFSFYNIHLKNFQEKPQKLIFKFQMLHKKNFDFFKMLKKYFKLHLAQDDEIFKKDQTCKIEHLLISFFSTLVSDRDLQKLFT